MKYYGSDKPDLRFDMKFVELMDIMKGHGFGVFDNAAYIGGICAPGAAAYTRKQLDQLTEYVKRPQIGAKGMVYARVEADGNVKSSVDKFYSQETLQQMKQAFNANPGDLILILSGDDVMKTRKQLCELRLEMGKQLGLRDKNKFACLWVVDFPMFEWSEEEQRLMAMHHPFIPSEGGGYTAAGHQSGGCPRGPRMTWWSTALKSAAAQSVSMTASFRQRCLKSSGSRPNALRSNSDS